MFPFTLAGPQFLGFYVALAALVLFAFWYYLNAEAESAISLSHLTADPYQIAYMRGAGEETLRVATVNLIDRGLLLHEQGTLRTAKENASDFVRRPLDGAILKRCASPTTPAGLSADAAVSSALDTYYDELQRKGLVLTGAQRASRMNALFIAGGVIGAVALVRILQALSRGQHNIAFLVVLAALALWLGYKLYDRAPFTTPAGTKALASLRTLLGRLKDRAHSLAAGGATNEALLLAAVFGLYSLPFAFVEQLFPKPTPSRSDRCGSSCGSSCGSTGCGGGGGGCGGCGGD